MCDVCKGDSIDDWAYSTWKCHPVEGKKYRQVYAVCTNSRANEYCKTEWGAAC